MFLSIQLAGDTQTSKPDDSESSWNGKKDAFDTGHEKTNSSELEGPVTGKAHVQTHTVNSNGRPGSSASSNSECAGAVSASGGRGLSPSSSLGSLSSEKSILNPNAKEFKFNPHAKSFVPSQAPVRPPSPVSDGSFYYPTNMPAVPHMPGMPVGIGVGQMQAPQAYYHPNGPQYGQQMLLGHPRQVVYMPSFQPEMPYKGRDY
ncbi:hypothetical protein M0R45_032105 [Rubus argutus]|uniref:Ataxin-2 C-terminal domain-containing protein n=1 Tax=Rubus argutus TaxID=59490 RepID=A0AAW1WK37_RUBAR